jgi:hypothetical protein
VKIRHYGLPGNRNRKKDLEACRKAAGVEVQVEEISQTCQKLLCVITGLNIMECPVCHGRI